MTRKRAVIPAWAAIAALAFWIPHTLWIRDVGGLHFDEAWAAGFAARIADAGGAFLPFQAQSPYTAAWGHYAGAAAFRVFGVSLAVFRVSQIAWVWLGALLGACALALKSGRRAATGFLWLCGFSLPLVLNHRLAIDVTTFHAFCLGLAALGAAAWSRWPRAAPALLGAGFWLGITSHLAFLAPALGLYLAAYGRAPWGRRARWLATGLGLLLLPRFVAIWGAIPETDKAAALIAVTLLAIGGAWLQPWIVRSQVFARARSWGRIPAVLAGSAMFLVFLLFWEGHWTAIFFLGWLPAPALVGGSLVLLLVLAATRIADRDPMSSVERDARDWFLGTLLVALAIMVKPTGRYFETPFLLFAGLLALSLARLPALRARAWLACAVLLGGLCLEENYLKPGREGLQRESDVRFLAFRELSGDTLSKQRVADFMAENGCGPEKSATADPRIEEALRFLGRGDWPVEARACPWPRVMVLHEREVTKMHWIISRVSGLVLVVRDADK